MKKARKVRISKDAMAAIRKAAETAGSRECMGLLAAPRGCDVVTEALPLRAKATGCHAEAEPEEIVRSLDEIHDRGLVPKGIFHSHASFNAFHSGVDEALVNRLLPQMAAQDVWRPKPKSLAPQVQEADRVVLPLSDGLAMEVTLLGRPVPEVGGHERAQWPSAQIAFGHTNGEPLAILGADRIRLEGGGVALTLPVPEGTSLMVRKCDPAPYRIARTYSIVVNTAGDAVAKCLSVYQLDGERIIREEDCEIEVVADGEPMADASAPAHDSSR